MKGFEQNHCEICINYMSLKMMLHFGYHFCNYAADTVLKCINEAENLHEANNNQAEVLEAFYFKVHFYK